MTDEELQSKTITFLRFPMMVGVVLIHAHIYEVFVNGINLLGVGIYCISNSCESCFKKLSQVWQYLFSFFLRLSVF